MNKSIALGVAAVAIVIGGVAIYTAGPPSSDDSAMMVKDVMEKESMQAADVMMKDDAAASDDAMMEKDTMMKDGAMEKVDSMTKETGATESMMKSGSYQAFSPTKIAMAATGDVVLFFRASWCPTCRAVDADIRAHLSDIPAGLTILDVDYDASAELKKKYGVTYQHTFVQVDAQGTMIKKWSGSPTLAALASQVQ